MPWEKQYNEEEVLDRATALFWQRGYEATSISDLVAVTGLNRGSLYTAFSDKRTLFIRSLRHYDKHYRCEFLAGIQSSLPPREAILELFRQLIASGQKGKNRKGCMMVNAALEMSSHDPEIDEIVNTSFKEVVSFIRRMVKAAQLDGSVAADISAKETSHVLFNMFLGLRVLSRAGPDQALMNTVYRQAESLLT